MKFEVLQENFSKSLGLISRLIPARPQIPILGNILLEATDNELFLAGGDGEVYVKTKVGAKISAAGSVCLPARTLVELVGSLSPGKLEISLADSLLEIRSGAFRGKINGQPADEYPQAKKTAPHAENYELQTNVLKKNLEKVIFATAADESRPALTGVLFRRQKGKLELVATDAFRLSFVKMDIAVGSAEDIIIPARVLSEVVRIAAENNCETISLQFFPGEIGFVCGQTEIFSRLVAAQYPSFEKIIPANSSFNITVPTSQFTAALKTAAIFARDNSNIIRLKISKKDTMVVSSTAAQLGEQEREIEVKTEGELPEDFVMAFNYHYLLDLLNNISADDLVGEFTTPVSPVVFKIAAEPNFLHIIMPVRIQG